MTTAQEHFEAGSLTDAIAAATERVKSRPTDSSARLSLAHFLCFNGEWDRADKQLDVVARQVSQGEQAITLYRQLIRAELARREFFREGRVPDFLEEPPPVLQAGLRCSISIREGDESAIRESFEEYRQLQSPLSGTCDGVAFEAIRDLDDLLGPVLEVLTATGKYYWVLLKRVSCLSFDKPERLPDLLWRHANVSFQNGVESSVYIPTRYPGTDDEEAEDLRLGHATDWREEPGGLVRGVGQKIWLIGEADRSLLELGEIVITASQESAVEE